ncbi:hypothetical protein [Brevundimonas naejangsanensis]|uniref:hypothetical protein n=1 Tax=Brevundimonas naejangsanensis TaxID=588932 RepID=UPI0039F7117D
MDAIDEVRMRLDVIEARLSVVEVEHSKHRTSVEALLAEQTKTIADFSQQSHSLTSTAVAASANYYVLQDLILRLTNQVAIVSATLGSAIQALKKGDAAASDQALADALEMQDRLGAMIDSLSGRPG